MEKMEQKFLAIAAHADDFELFASGVCELGQVLVGIVVSPDDTRYAEMKRAQGVLGYSVILLHYVSDGDVYTVDIRGRVARSIEEFKPRVLLTHDPWKAYQLHPDHRAVGFQTTDAITLQRLVGKHVPEELWYWNSGDPNHQINESGQKYTALSQYASQRHIWEACITTKLSQIEKFHRVTLEEVFG